MQALLHELHYRMLQGIDLFLLVSVEEHLGTAVNQESSVKREINLCPTIPVPPRIPTLSFSLIISFFRK